MENAAKALVIAGGILLAIITISLFVYMTTATSRMAQAQDEKTALEQLVAFNSEYEAYNKRVMYGTDVITVVNKAIVHNEKMLASKIEDPYYINIIIETKEDFITTFEEIDNTKQGKEAEPQKIEWANIPDSPENNIKEKLDPNLANDGIDQTFKLDKDKYELGKFQEEGKSFITNRDFKSFFSASKVDKTVITSDKTKTYKMYSALSNFKRAIFECPANGVVYNNQTGRIESMTFIQKKIN